MGEGPQKARMMAKSRILFWQEGYDRTSMRDIASACGCKPANIYNYFSSKEDLLYEILYEEMQGVIAPIKHLEDDDDTNPIQQLRLIINSHLNLTLGYRRSSKLLFDMELGKLSPAKRKGIIELRDTYDRILCRVIRRNIDAGFFPEIDEKLATYSIASMIVRSRIWFSPKGRLSVKEVADFIFNFALSGLRSEKTNRRPKSPTRGAKMGKGCKIE